MATIEDVIFLCQQEERIENDAKLFTTCVGIGFVQTLTLYKNTIFGKSRLISFSELEICCANDLDLKRQLSDFKQRLPLPNNEINVNNFWELMSLPGFIEHSKKIYFPYIVRITILFEIEKYNEEMKKKNYADPTILENAIKCLDQIIEKFEFWPLPSVLKGDIFELWQKPKLAEKSYLFARENAEIIRCSFYISQTNEKLLKYGFESIKLKTPIEVLEKKCEILENENQELKRRLATLELEKESFASRLGKIEKLAIFSLTSPILNQEEPPKKRRIEDAPSFDNEDEDEKDKNEWLKLKERLDKL